MDISSIELPGSEVEAIKVEGDRVILRFSKAYIVKSMTGSKERTRWWQAGELVFDQAEAQPGYPEGPCICTGGDVGENVYTYRDMISIPLNSKGRAHCELQFEGTEARLSVQAGSVSLNMEDRPHYIEHLRTE
ncbi:MAG: hypothetical protein GY703_21595 [Gammaproteobacteria bacterium]|nr:hypothetical protein [Gammaproteobacteria bacterium]